MDRLNKLQLNQDKLTNRVQVLKHQVNGDSVRLGGFSFRSVQDVETWVAQFIPDGDVSMIIDCVSILELMNVSREDCL